MKTKFFFMAAIVLCAVAANANTWRLNYDENAHADFRTLKQACESPEVQDGDIFYMEPGFHNGSDEDNTISRPCTVIGPGWGFKNNAGEEIEVSTTHFTSNINVRENGVHIVGLNAQEVSILLNKLYTNVNNPQRDVIIELPGDYPNISYISPSKKFTLPGETYTYTFSTSTNKNTINVSSSLNAKPFLIPANKYETLQSVLRQIISPSLNTIILSK